MFTSGKTMHLSSQYISVLSPPARISGSFVFICQPYLFALVSRGICICEISTQYAPNKSTHTFTFVLRAPVAIYRKLTQNGMSVCVSHSSLPVLMAPFCILHVCVRVCMLWACIYAYVLPNCIIYLTNNLFYINSRN